MTCPDPLALIDDDDAKAHARECPSCAEVVRLLEGVRSAFSPPVALGARLESLGVEAITRSAAEERERSAVGALVTFVLATLTLMPPSLHALASWHPDATGAAPAILSALVLAAVVTLLEPRIADG